MAISKTTQPVKKQIDTLLHVFAAGDGGVSFVRVKGFLEATEAKADAGDLAAEEILCHLQGLVNLVQHVGGFDNEDI
ncbi:hypothetical protein VPHD239_0054 [Vibrio phage D239]